MAGRIKYGPKKTPDGYFLVVVPAEIFEALKERTPAFFKEVVVEYAGAEVFVKVKSRRLAIKIARKAELLLSRKRS